VTSALLIRAIILGEKRVKWQKVGMMAYAVTWIAEVSKALVQENINKGLIRMLRVYRI
jgi:hypothetical protein